MPCVHMQIDAALDRWRESHWHLHQIEENYHAADAFRYSMNSFIRSIREVPALICMSLQNISGFTEWHRPIKEALEKGDPLFHVIISHRNLIVHHDMLVPGSHAQIAAIRGLTIKMAFPFKVDPFEDSDSAIDRFLARAKKAPDIIRLPAPDETQMLSIIREWRIEGIDDEVIAAFRKAWVRVRVYLSEVTAFLGGDHLDCSEPECFKDPRIYQYKKYPQLLDELLIKATDKMAKGEQARKDGEMNAPSIVEIQGPEYG